MSFKKRQPGCPCCCDCDCMTFEDAFASNSIADYTQIAGTWSISGGKLRCSDNMALILCDTEATEAEHSLSVHGLPQTVGDIWQIIIAYKDASNYLYAKLTRTAIGGDGELHEVIGGIDTLLDSLVNIGASGEFALCYRNGEVALSRALSDPEDQPTVTSAYADSLFGVISVPSALGTKAGIATDTIDTELQIVYFEIRSACDDNCPNCLARVCQTGTEFTEVQVTFSRVANDWCSTCNDWNATYILDSHRGIPSHYALLLADGSGSSTTTLPNCDKSDSGYRFVYDRVQLTVACNSENVVATLSVIRVKSSLTSTSETVEATGSITLATGPDCCKVDCVALLDGATIQMSDTDNTADLCDWDNATATLAVSRSI